MGSSKKVEPRVRLAQCVLIMNPPGPLIAGVSAAD